MKKPFNPFTYEAGSVVSSPVELDESIERKNIQRRESESQVQARMGTSLGERMYTPKELMPIFRFKEDKIRRMFEYEPGVMVIAQPPTKYKRGYKILRIPESVVRRVLRRSTNV